MELQINDRLAYAATGNRPLTATRETVLFVHGAGQNHTIWVLPMRYFARKGLNVVSIDLPGHGGSAGPALSSIEAMADWVVRLLDATGLKRTAIVGHSMGSLVALAAAARHPDRIRALAMVGTSVPMPVSDPLLHASSDNQHAALDMLTYWGHSATAHLASNPTPGMWMLGCSMRLLEQADDGVVHTDLTACHTYHAGLAHAAGVSCPTLLILGERDVMTPVAATRKLAATIPAVQQVVLAGAGHALLAERPDPILDALVGVVL